MRKLLFLAVLGALPLAGCKNEASPDTKTAAGTPAAAKTYEIACAKCVYKMPNASTCAAAVKVDGKNLLVTATPPFDIMAVDGCKAPKQATVEGKVEGDKFVATKIEVKK